MVGYNSERTMIARATLHCALRKHKLPNGKAMLDQIPNPKTQEQSPHPTDALGKTQTQTRMTIPTTHEELSLGPLPGTSKKRSGFMTPQTLAIVDCSCNTCAHKWHKGTSRLRCASACKCQPNRCSAAARVFEGLVEGAVAQPTGDEWDEAGLEGQLLVDVFHVALLGESDERFQTLCALASADPALLA